MLSLAVRKVADKLRKLKLTSKFVPCYCPFVVNTLPDVRGEYLGGWIFGVETTKVSHKPGQAATANVSKLLFVSLGENRFNYSIL